MYYSKPFNPGDVLRFGDYRAGEFGAYDEYDPWAKVYWNPATGEFVTDGTGEEFLLNFYHLEGPDDPYGVGAGYAPVPTDGDDVIFGDLGNDWLVGGTGKDHLYGGYGYDLLNVDDDHTTNYEANDMPDTHPSYEDLAYGGAGRDVLIGNTGGDRLIDWAGEFNSYIVPFPPFGMATVSRTLQPQLQEFLYDLSESDGADPTRNGDPARNGEPYGELGLVKQQDFDWKDQTGAPDDPQPGNIPGGKRDVLRSASFDGVHSTTLHGFYVDSGLWNVENGALKVSAESLGGDAASVFHVDEVLPSYFEIQATITMEKPTSGWKANSYVIFDYYGQYDFKFAGLNASIDKIQMGHRDETGWHVDVQSNMKIKPGQYYNMLVAVHGTNVTLLANNKEYFSHMFEPRVIDGWVYGLNTGMVGFGSDNSQGVYDNIAVQVLPPEITLEETEDFEGQAELVFVSTSGDWQINANRYNGTPAVDSDKAISLVDLGLDRGLEVVSVLELEATLNTQTTGGVVFDYYGPDNFKFAAISAESNQVIIGHFTAKRGWSYDAVFDYAIEPGTDYELALSLKGTTVSLSVKESGAKNWQAMAGHVFNAVTVDGDFGLLSKDGTISFDAVTVKTDDPAFRDDGDNLMAAEAPVAQAETESMLTYDDLSPIVDEAIERWADALGINGAMVTLLHEVSFQIVDFNDLTLGRAIGDTVLIDADAAGFGWFVDTTPYDDTEFRRENVDGELLATASSSAYGDMDLLTVVMHELGHVLGFEDLDPEEYPHDLMSGTLATGVRRLDIEVDQSIAAGTDYNLAIPLYNTKAHLWWNLQILSRYSFGSILNDWGCLA